MSSNIDLGLVTAYGYAVEAGFTGTEAEFAQMLANVITYKNAAESAADNAAISAGLAEQYKDEAFSGTPTGYEQLVSDVYSLETEEDVMLAGTPTFTGRVLLDKMYGMSTQATTPTPSSPVAIKSAKANLQECGGINLIPYDLDYIKALNTIGSWVGNVYTYGSLSVTFNEDGTIVVNGSVSGNTYIPLWKNKKIFSLKNGTQYKIWAGNSEMTSAKGTLYVNSPEVLSYENEVTFTYSGQTTLAFIAKPNVTYVNFVIKPMIRLASVSSNTFVSPKYNKVTTDLVLRAIEVGSTDAYNVVKDGKYYVADTLEKIEGGYQITRRFETITLDGSEGIFWDGASVGKTATVSSISKFTSKMPVVPNYNAKFKGLCNHFIVVSGADINEGQTVGVSMFVLNNTNYLKFRTTSVMTSAEFNSWLQSNNVEIIYELATPTVETVSNANAKKLLSLKSYDEATGVAQTEDTEGVMVLKYGSTELSNMAVTGYVEGEQNSIRLSDLESAV